MKSLSILGSVLAVSLVLGACGGGDADAEPAPPAEPMGQAAANALRDALANQYMSRSQSTVEFYADNAVAYGIDGSAHEGKAAVAEALTAAMMAGVDSIGLVSQSFEASGDVATDRGTIVVRKLDPETKEATRANGNYMLEFARQPDGGFKIVKDSAWMANAPK